MLSYSDVRAQTLQLVEPFSAEDMQLQSMPDASPAKWHLAHTTWFFETFILKPHYDGYQVFDTRFEYLFNSYYDAVGERHPRPERGLLSRPSIERVLQYRAYVDQHMNALLAQFHDDRDCSDNVNSMPAALKLLVTTGLHHEMQHQELIITDIKHALARNPVALGEVTQSTASESVSEPAQGGSSTINRVAFSPFQGGLTWVGQDPNSQQFGYDCERPAHQQYLNDFYLADRLVTNQQWLAFINDGGYHRPELWLSEGWAVAQQNRWQAPMYWFKRNDLWLETTLAGQQAINLNAPVCHVSYYEADAFARYAGARLPTEAEWERVAASQASDALEKAQFLNPLSTHQVRSVSSNGMQQLFGSVWQWTQSPFTPYPGFEPAPGALSEYNGKFMINQMVLRGGSCATPAAQMRSSYRNFFHPHQRWQYSGVRLAKS